MTKFADRYVVKPYGKWYQHLLHGRFELAYRAIVGWKRSGPYGSAMILDNLAIEIPPRLREG